MKTLIPFILLICLNFIISCGPNEHVVLVEKNIKTAYVDFYSSNGKELRFNAFTINKEELATERLVDSLRREHCRLNIDRIKKNNELRAKTIAKLERKVAKYDKNDDSLLAQNARDGVTNLKYRMEIEQKDMDELTRIDSLLTQNILRNNYPENVVYKVDYTIDMLINGVEQSETAFQVLDENLKVIKTYELEDI
jgi:hypothetical protein